VSVSDVGFVVLVAVIALLALGSGVAPAAAIPAGGNDSVSVAALYPNPVADGDTGEFVVLRATQPTRLDNWTVSDGEDTVRLPNVTLEGRVVLSMAPNRTRNLTAGPVRALGGHLALANGGDSLTLARDGRVVATLSWDSAPEGSIGRPGGDGGELDWRPVGASDFRPVDAGSGRVRPFVLPDAGGLPAEVLASADRRILLGGYTLTAERVGNALRNASQRGVRVVVLVDGEPVGGMTHREARLLDSLVAAGVRVRVLGGSGAPYAFHHAKYAVVDDRAVVTTENWKPAGVGGHSSRGWGVVVGTDRIVDGLTRTFQSDSRGRGSQSWRAFATDASFEPADAPPANATYPSRFRPGRFRASSVALLVAPDNAEPRLVARMDNASESIRVQQVTIGSRRQPFLRATLRAARRGVDVDVLLSGAWYVREENRALVRWLNDLAAREGLPLDARLADPRGRYEKIHAKGVIVDDSVVVGSLNWNNHSARENREVVLVLSGQNVTQYYRRVFRADWRGGNWRLPAGLVALTILCWLVALLVGRRFEFERPRA
jgi:phosphatidylserine/phosphatidylglycerophosphate/cardiolipin synthase-like enzyme